MVIKVEKFPVKVVEVTSVDQLENIKKPFVIKFGLEPNKCPPCKALLNHINSLSFNKQTTIYSLTFSQSADRQLMSYCTEKFKIQSAPLTCYVTKNNLEDTEEGNKISGFPSTRDSNENPLLKKLNNWIQESN